MKNGQYCVFGNESYGLYSGKLIESKERSDGLLDCDVEGCRHICAWYGKKGGITSLARSGICGPEAEKSRVGGAAPVTRLTKIVNVFACTDEARESIESHGRKND